MTILQQVYLYLLTIPVFFAIDIVWIAYVARAMYQEKLGAFLGPVNWTAAGVFYLLYIAGILVFAVLPGLKADSALITLGYGAFLGVVAYATYDLTNLATFKGWPLSVTIADIVWGAVLTASVAYISFRIGKAFFVS